MHEVLRAGVPGVDEYRRLLQHPAFLQLQEHSDRFLDAHRRLLEPYARRWVIDPLHQWSRQWEYPFMAAALREVVAASAQARVLDAGSGLTFFPFFLLDEFGELEVHCCDIDPTLAPLYDAIASQRRRHPKFANGDLGRLPYPDAWFDAVYCVSVLEHIPSRDAVIAEFRRVLKPGGALILSFDLCPDGSRDIGIPEAQRLVAQLAGGFTGTERFELDRDFADPSTYFNTESAAQIDRRLLPWHYPAFVYQVRALLQGKGWPRWPPLLTVSCAVLHKHADAMS